MVTKAFFAVLGAGVLTLGALMAWAGDVRWRTWSVEQALEGKGVPPYNWRVLVSWPWYEHWLDDHQDSWMPGP